MFERNKVDTGVQHVASVPAEVEDANGTVLKGRFIFTAARAFADVLNGPSQFLEFEGYEGPRQFLSKSAIRSVRLVAVPQAGQLDARRRDSAAFDPHQVLGVAHAAPFDEIRQAYLRLSKTYHPDRYQSVELPAEVRDYLAAMAARINVAYAALERDVQIEKAKVSTRVEPVYTSRPRA